MRRPRRFAVTPKARWWRWQYHREMAEAFELRLHETERDLFAARRRMLDAEAEVRQLRAAVERIADA
jgi:hypothetical protein